MKKIGIGLLIVFTLLILFAFWYKWQYSMDRAESFEVNSSELHNKVLIASQGSDFKMNLVSSIVDDLRDREVYIKVIDVADLKNVKEETWNAIVIIHTWEYNQPQKDASNFIDGAINPENLIIIGTSGSGDLRIKGIDGMSSASMMSEIKGTTEFVLSKIEEKLQ